MKKCQKGGGGEGLRMCWSFFSASRGRWNVPLRSCGCSGTYNARTCHACVTLRPEFKKTKQMAVFGSIYVDVRLASACLIGLIIFTIGFELLTNVIDEKIRNSPEISNVVNKLHNTSKNILLCSVYGKTILLRIFCFVLFCAVLFCLALLCVALFYFILSCFYFILCFRFDCLFRWINCIRSSWS